MKISSIQTLDTDHSVCMAAICYSGPKSVALTNDQFLHEKRTGAKFQIDILKTERLSRIHTDGRTDRWTLLNRLSLSR